MTDKEALSWFEGWLSDYYDCLDLPDRLTTEIANVAIAAIREKVERESEKPLTIEELREMEGEPVWLETDDGKSKWVVVELDVYEEIYGARKNGLWLHDYGKTWLAYRHKPEEANHEV